MERCCPNLLRFFGGPLTALKRRFCRPAALQPENTTRLARDDHGPQVTVDVDHDVNNTELSDTQPGNTIHGASQSGHLTEPSLPSKADFLSMIETRFPNNHEVYAASSQILSDLQNLGSNDEEALCAILHRAQELFEDHVDIMLGLNGFFPDGLCIERSIRALPRNTIQIASSSELTSDGSIASINMNVGGDQSIQREDADSDADLGSTFLDQTLFQRRTEPVTSPVFAPTEQALSISEGFLELMKTHFADAPDEYARIIKLVENFTVRRTIMLEEFAQLAVLLWGCTYLMECLASCLPTGHTLECTTVFELCNVFKLVSSTSSIPTRVPPNLKSDDNLESRFSYSARFFLILGDRVGCLSLPDSTLTSETRDTPSGVPLVTVFENVKWLGGEHDGYPISHSWDEYFQRRRLVLLGSTRPSDPGNDALAQSWFTLGLLESVVEKKIPSKLMLDSSPTGDGVISSRNLPIILRDWRRRMRALRHVDEHAFRRWFSHAEITLKELLAFLVTATRFPQECIFGGSNYLPNLHMIAAIGEALMASMAEFQNFMQPMAGYVWSVVLGRYPVHKLYEEGWCPFTVSMLLSSVCLVQYAGTRKPYLRRGLGHSTFDHSKCTRTGCSLNNIDPNVPYVNRHADDSCHCLYSKPPVDEIKQALTRNEIPVIIVEEADPSPDTPDITCMTSSQTRYVAISHVWADGLGSITEDGLPACQLRRLSKLTRKLLPEERGALWMDALCVPGVKEMRKRAIRLMSKTYKDAAFVLVIDAGIRTCSLDTSPEEKLLRVLTSAWMQRLWTLQEALLAQNLFFELADSQLVSLQELIPWDEESCTMDGLKWLLIREMAPIVIFSQDTPTEPVKYLFLHRTDFDLGSISHALVKRTTSRKEDETLAIASLLGVDVSKLLDVSTHEERMKILLLELQFIPSGIIFSVGEKLSEPGFRWAPRSFLGQMSPNTDRNALCTSKGLAGKYPWFYFDETTIGHNEMWFLRHRESGHYYLVEDGIADPSRYTCNGVLLSPPINTSQSGFASRKLVHAVAVKMAVDRENCEYRRKVVLYPLTVTELEVGREQFQNKKIVDIQDMADLKLVLIT
ncbi:hypothetical protein VKT23_006118 [Stygiomarasmius scandens]|uniref:Heterokaryon incompatibility domain-containing protein n=1 Tax=Marasmiellus scandens TaxID=2682957 RepID=A0ABR1JTZ7_9AGAR